MRNSNCKLCGLYSSAQKICIWGEGPKPTKIMVIGEAPRYKREKWNIDKPFAGKSGKILDIVLEELNISREEIYVTNALHCGLPENRIPKMDEIRACRKYLLMEIKEVKPKIIICLGSIALKGLYDSNLMSITRERGKILEFEGIKVIPSYHPAAALYNKYIANLLHSDLKEGIERINNNSGIKVNENNHYQLAAKEHIPPLCNSKVISVDVETTGLDYMDPKLDIVTMNMSIEPHRSFIFKKENLNQVKEILKDKEIIINHNIKFDLEWLNRYGIKANGVPIFDTMVAKHLLDENYPDKELKHLARVELNMIDLSEAEKVMIKHRKEETNPSIEEYVRYGGGDSDAALRLFMNYKKSLERENLIDLMNVEMKVLKTLTRMEIFGFKIDLKEHRRLLKEYEIKIKVSQSKIDRLVGEINLNSNQQLQKLLYRRLDLPITLKTANGAPSCNEAALNELLLNTNDPKKKKVLEMILDHRGLDKLYNTYLKGLIENNLLKYDGKVHCDFKICGTKTGRLSCADPNLENIPRDGDIKNMFISSFKDGRIIQVDYSQMELRILAHYSNDKKLIQAFKDGRDIHKEVAARVFHIPYDKVSERQRKYTKQVNFGIVYLISPQGLAGKIGCSINEADNLINDWFKEFPRVKEWINERKEEIMQTGKSVSISGRIRRLYGANENTREGRQAIRQGVNSPIQGGAGDITKYSMMRLDRRLNKLGLESRVHNNVHDSVMIDSPEEEVKEVIKYIREIFVDYLIPLKVPLGFEIKVGKNWGELEKYND